jgi:hypothetical protein
MQIFDIFEASQARKLVVTYPGRFQPFHQGHAEVFQSLQSKFGSDNVYIVSADKVEQPKSPFSFSDKVQFMRAAGIPAHSIINTNKVYDLPDQFQTEKDNIVFIAVVGEPDAKRLNPGSTKKDGSASYFQPWTGDFKQAQTADKHGYVIVEPERPKVIEIGGEKVDVSHGTPVRALWNKIKSKPELRKNFIQQMYGQYHAELEPILDKISESYEHGFADPRAPKLGGRRQNDEPDAVNNIEVSIDGRPWKVFAGKGLDSSPEFFRQKQMVDAMCKRKTEQSGKKWSWGVTGAPATMTEMNIGKKKSKPDSFSINKDGKPASLASYANKDSAIKDRDEKYPDAKVHQIGPRGKVKAEFEEGWFSDEPASKDPWFLKKDGDVMRSPTGTPLMFKSKQEALQWAMKTFKVSFEKQRIIPTTNPDKNLITTGAVAEEAAGVGVVKNGKDPRYMTATMGDQNKVTADTLPQMMKNYNLIPGKKKTLESKDDLRLHLKRNRFKALAQRKRDEEERTDQAMRNVANEIDKDPTDNIDSAMQQFLDKGGKVELLPYKKPRAMDRMNWGSKHIGTGRGGKAANQSGLGANTMPGAKPVVTVESAIIRRIIAEHKTVLAQHGPGACMEAAREVGLYVGQVDYITEDEAQVFTKQAIRNLNRNLYEGMFEFNPKDPYNSEFAPDVGMGRMTLRSWKQSLARRLQDLNNYVQEATQAGNIDKAVMWENIYKKMQNLNLDPIAKEIELAHTQLEVMRKQGGVRSRAFQLQEMKIMHLEENWKKKLAALGLAGAIGMGAAGPAQADFIDDIMEPVHKVNKVVRDVQNLGRNTGEKIHYYKDKVGRNIEQVPIPGAEKYGRELRGDVPPPLVDTSPEAAENARRNAEMNREEQRLKQQRQQQHNQQMQQVPDRPWHDKY